MPVRGRDFLRFFVAENRRHQENCYLIARAAAKFGSWVVGHVRRVAGVDRPC